MPTILDVHSCLSTSDGKNIYSIHEEINQNIPLIRRMFFDDLEIKLDKLVDLGYVRKETVPLDSRVVDSTILYYRLRNNSLF